MHQHEIDNPQNDVHSNEDNFQIECKQCGGICCYADDSTFTISDKDPMILKEKIDGQYQVLAKYMTNNRLILNSDKTHLLVMTSSTMHRFHGNFDITLNTESEVIEPQDNETLLGGIISSDLKWIEHIQTGKKSMLTQIT